HLAEEQVAHRVFAAIRDRMSSSGATEECRRLTLAKLAPTGRRAQARPAAEDHHQLFAAVMEVVDPLLARRQLPAAQPDPLTASLIADPRPPVIDAVARAFLIEVRREGVRHLGARYTRRRASRPGRVADRMA